jgi:hypothetical protein
MSLMNRIGKLARSEQGKKLFSEAQKVAKNPATRQKIADARRRFQRRPPA